MKKRKRGRPRKKKISSSRKLKQAKEILGKGRHRDFVYLTCKRCGQERRIHTNNKEVYTDDVRKKFICIWCK